MRAQNQVAVLEWVCGGGLLDAPQGEISPGLVEEGHAMLLTIVEGLAAGSDKGAIDVIVPLDTRLFSQHLLTRIDAIATVVDVRQTRWGGYLESWIEIAQECQWSWLIAPELHNTLSQVAQRLRTAGISLFNCDEEFLRNASNKSITNQLLCSAGIRHPPTRCLSIVNTNWLDEMTQWVANQSDELQPNAMRWVIKPVDGAGGEGLHIVDRRELIRIQNERQAGNRLNQSSFLPADLLVQPMLDGIAASCSAIVDRAGRAHWMPVVSQDFCVDEVHLDRPGQALVTAAPLSSHDSPSRDQFLGRDTSPEHTLSSNRNAAKSATPVFPTNATLRYLGGTYPALSLPAEAPHELLNRTLTALKGSALGWVGIDLLFNPRLEQWWVIEVNPRCTTSLVGLAEAYRGNLLRDLVGLQTGSLSELGAGFAPLRFRVGGMAFNPQS